MYKCKKCGKEFETKEKLGGHASSHNRDENYRKKRYKNGVREQRRKRLALGNERDCKFCGKKFNSKSIGGHVARCEFNPNYRKTVLKTAEKRKGVKMSFEQKQKISNSMKSAHNEGRAWNIGKSRWNNEKSYPEKFFEKVILNEFEDKKYKCEYPIGKYSLDFAWPHLNKAIEIDGDQHERFREYKERDVKKDKFCNENGWKILRIKWKDLFHKTKEKIADAKKFLN